MDINIAKVLLERYFEGKDENKPEVIENLFSDTATVTFEIRPDNIKFPSRITGAKNIAETMFNDFHDNFDQITSYYIESELPDLDQDKIICLKWLVVMREKCSGLFRIGTGYYDWHFGLEPKVDKLHIYIHDMVVCPEKHTNWAYNLQSRFFYPWLPLSLAISELKDNDMAIGIYDYLNKDAKN
jgi:hypothetical protein